jgi:hypothetical protein
MGYIKEPTKVDFVVDPTPLTTEDRKKISEIIAYYKATGRKMHLPKSKPKHRAGSVHSGQKKMTA